MLKCAKNTSNRNSFNLTPSLDFLDGLFSSNQVSGGGDDDEESKGEDGNEEEDWEDNGYFTNLKGNSYCQSPAPSIDDEEQGCQVEKDSGEPSQEEDEGDKQDEDLDVPNVYEDAAEENSPPQRKCKAIREQDSQHRKVKVHLDNKVCTVFLSSCPLIYCLLLTIDCLSISSKKHSIHQEHHCTSNKA